MLIPMQALRIVILMLLAATGCCWATNLTQIAAGTTIAVNALEIKENYQRVKKAAKATKRVVVKTAKKVAGK